MGATSGKMNQSTSADDDGDAEEPGQQIRPTHLSRFRVIL